MADVEREKSAVEQEKDWLTIKEVGARLQVSEQTIYRWMRDGAITFYKIGDSTRFKPEDVEMVIEKHASFKEAEKVSTSCPSCGHFELEPGKLSSTGKVYFRPEKVKFLTLREPMVEIQALACPRCGNIILSADTEKMNILRKKPRDEEIEN
ncbi:MAG: helix-turn-helix domain-containing protein [Planctomycetota bacterium]